MFPLYVPQVLQHETSYGCDKPKAAALKLSGNLLPSTMTGHGPGMPTDVEVLADATAGAALVATAAQHYIMGAAPTAPPNTAPPFAPPRPTHLPAKRAASQKSLPGRRSSGRCRPRWAAWRGGSWHAYRRP